MKVILIQPQRITMPAGSVVDVDDATASWLIGNGVAEAQKEEKTAPKKAAKK